MYFNVQEGETARSDVQQVEIIFGPPGTGKTEELMGIIQRELSNGVPAIGIAFVTFTKQGATVGRQRTFERFSKTGDIVMSDLVNFGTIHSMCFRALGMKRESVMQGKDYRNFSKAMGMKFLGHYTEEFQHGDDFYLFLEQMERSNKEKFDKMIEGANNKKYEHVKHNYKRYKDHVKKIDYTDMLEMFLREKVEIPVDVAIIDEAQDLTSLQWEVARCAFRGAKRIYVAQDDDQALFSWSGADLKIAQGLQGVRRTLKKSWRLPSKIANFAQDVIKGVATRVDKPYTPNEEGGEILFYQSFNEVPISPDRTWYFLSRNNCFLTAYREKLQDMGVLYYNKGEKSVEAKHIKLIKLYKEAIKRGELTREEMVLLKRHVRKDFVLGDPIDKVFYFGEKKGEAEYMEKIIDSGVTEFMPYYVDTMHGVKGGEADDVVIMLDCTKAVWEAMEKQHSLDDEIRVLYVAITRAKKRVHIIMPNREKNMLKILDPAIKRIKE